jgi:hypothetical protein
VPLLGHRAKGRDVVEDTEPYQLREVPGRYKALFGVEKDDIALENILFWKVNRE